MMNRAQTIQVPALPRLATDPIQDEFERFHNANPHVYTKLVELARKAKSSGFSEYSVKALIEVVRWEIALETKSNDGWRVNDHFSSRFARLIDAQEPDLRGFFEFRALGYQRKAA